LAQTIIFFITTSIYTKNLCSQPNFCLIIQLFLTIQLLWKHRKYIFHFREVLYALRLWKMDSGEGEYSDTEYNGVPCEWRTLCVADPNRPLLAVACIT